MTFQKKLDEIIKKNNSLLCVGLDPVLEKLPKEIQKEKNPFFIFNKKIIDATHDVVCCYKPNSAFYEAHGEKGIGELKKTCDYLRKKFPKIPIILDAKRGDIGNTNNGYKTFAFDYLQADAITVQPYLGKEALEPFLSEKGKGIFVLCKTSNLGSGEFQNLRNADKSFYQIVAEHVVKEWNNNSNCYLVVGATYPEELREIRKIAGDMTFLVPGVGTQGGDMKKTLQAGLNRKKTGMIITSSREVLYASPGEDFAQKSREKAIELKAAINLYR